MEDSLQPLSVEQLRREREAGTQLLDLRDPMDYAREHIPGTVNIPYMARGFRQAIEYFLVPERPLAMVSDEGEHVRHAASNLDGYSVRGYLAGGYAAWKQAGGETSAIGEISPGELAVRIEAGTAPPIIDVREEWEFRNGRVPGSRLIPIATIMDNLERIPKDGPVVFSCASGNRSSEVVHHLYRLGYRQVYNLTGGMKLWQADGHPVER